MIPFVNLIAQRAAYKTELEQAEKAVLDSGCFVGGPIITEFEKKLENFCGIKHALTCGSGTEALTIALMALGVSCEDEVIVPDFTFIAPAECVAGLGAKPVFADIDPETLQISTKSVQALITPKTRGIIAVDLFGQCAPYKALREIAMQNHLWILEDAAQAFGAKVHTNEGARYACTFGDIAITSFYPSKPLGCYGDGGALFTNNDEYAAKIRQIANHGSSKHYLHEIIGLNSRLDALQAAILQVKMNHFEAELAIRQKNAQKYDEFFADLHGIRPQKIAEGNTSTYAQYTLLVDNRNDFIAKLDQAQIPYCIHYPMALHQQPCFGNVSNRNSAEEASSKALSLPVCAFTDVDFIINQMRQIL